MIGTVVTSPRCGVLNSPVPFARRMISQPGLSGLVYLPGATTRELVHPLRSSPAKMARNLFMRSRPTVLLSQSHPTKDKPRKHKVPGAGTRSAGCSDPAQTETGGRSGCGSCSARRKLPCRKLPLHFCHEYANRHSPMEPLVLHSVKDDRDRMRESVRSRGGRPRKHKLAKDKVETSHG